MIPFVVNSKYYSPVIQSYTSNDEFYLNKRVWENNELPSWDPYDAVHSMLHDELWKEFLGSTSITYDVPFNYETEAEEYFDSENIITHPSIAKYVNGIRSNNYGPVPYYHYEKDQPTSNGGMADYDEEKYNKYGNPEYIERKHSLRYNSIGNIEPALTYVPGQWIYRPIWPTYTRYEIDGTIAPEFDFLLHEGYRYLKTLYPNHPDYNTLLTTNEINDEFNQISTLINFPINCAFYDWLATQLKYDPSIDVVDLYQLYKDEALKLKFRNLTKHAFRRKLFGAKAGYWMFGSEALQHITVYPVAEYLPLKPHLYNELSEKYIGTPLENEYIYDNITGYISGNFSGKIIGQFAGNIVKEDQVSGYYNEGNFNLDENIYGSISGVISGILNGVYNAIQINSREVSEEFYNIGSPNNFKWYKKLFHAPDLFRERAVNYEDTFYKHPYRLIDFSNGSYDLKHRYIPPIKIWGTAYPTPLSPYDLYEYPSERDIYIPLTMQNDFYESQKVWFGDKNKQREDKTPGYINAMFYEDSYEVILNLKYENELLINSTLATKTLEDTLVHVQVTTPIYPIYQEFEIHKSIEETLQLAINNSLDLTEFKSKTKLFDQIQELYKLVPDYIVGNIAIEIHQNGNIFLPPQQFLSLYEDNLDIAVDRIDIDNPEIEYYPTGIDEINGFIKTGDIILKEATLITTMPDGSIKPAEGTHFISEICGLEGGILEIKITKPYLLSEVQKDYILNTINKYTEPRYGIILQFSLNNADSHGKKIIIFGRPEFIFSGPDYNNLYNVDRIIFTISSIPRIKSNNILKIIYRDFPSLAIQKVKDLVIVFGDAQNLPDNNFYKYYYVNEARKILENYTNFKNFINDCYKYFKEENKTRNEVEKAIKTVIEMFNYPDYTDPENKYFYLNNYLNTYNTELDSKLIIYPDKLDFDTLNNNLWTVFKEYQDKFYNDLVTYRFPIKDSVDGMNNQLDIILPKVQQIWDIIQNIEDTGIWTLDEDYETFYKFYNTFVDFFDYSSNQGGLQQKIKELFPEFKLRADNEIFAIAIQPTIFKLHEIIEALKVEVEWIFDIIDKGGQAPYPILTGENFQNLLANIEIYKDFYKPYDNYEEVVIEINAYQHEVYNAINPMYPRKFNDCANELYAKIEEFRAPFIQEPVEYSTYIDTFMSEIDKYYKIFLEDLIDMPILIADKPVRFPIEANMRILFQCLEDFTKAFDDELAHWIETLSYTTSILNDYFRYENDIRKFHYDDIGDNVEELKRQLSIIYTSFKNTVNPMSINDDTFVNHKTLILNKFNEYITFYNDQLKYMIATDLDRFYYSDDNPDFDMTNFTSEQKQSVATLRSLDSKLDNYLPNRGLLLKPLPDDVYMYVLSSTNSSYSLLSNQDIYAGILGFKFDNYNTFIEYDFIKEFANTGIMTDYSPGSVNTAQLIHKDKETVPSSEMYISSQPYIREYDIQGETYFDLNKDIILANKTTLNKKKFSYCNLEWLELFLPEDKKQNIEGDIPKRYEVEIRSIITKDSNRIEFIDEASKGRIHAITTGDQIIGPNIEDDTFIESIDLSNFIVVTNKPMNVSADLVLTYLTRYNLYPEEFKSHNFFDYRVDLSKVSSDEKIDNYIIPGHKSFVDTGSIIEKVFYEFPESDYPNTSQHFVNGYIDVLKYRQDLLNNLKTQIKYRSYFNIIVKNSHNDNKDLSLYYTLPSVINYFGTAYLEVNAFRLYKNNEYLMVKEVLDYFQDYLHDLSRASDNVNVGVNIIATTDTTGLISRELDQQFTDPNINLKFVTTKSWVPTSIPTYIELGIGYLDEVFEGVSKTEDPQKLSEQSKFYYNWDVYDDHHISEGSVPLGNEEDDYTTYTQLNEEGITLENETGAMYGAQEIETKMETAVDYFEHVDIPVITYKIGEYEVQRYISFENYLDSNKRFTTIQFSIIKQCFENINIVGDPVKQFTKNFVELKILQNISSNYERFIDSESDEIILIREEDKSDSIYRGEWEPSSFVNSDGIKEIKYPEDETANSVIYYSLNKSITLTQVYDKYKDKIDTYSFKFGTILVWENNKWIIKDFTFVGLLGNKEVVRNNTILEDGQEDERDNIKINNPIIYPKIGYTLKYCLILKLLKSANIGFISDDNPNDAGLFSEAELIKIFEWICDEHTRRENGELEIPVAVRNTYFTDPTKLSILSNITSYRSSYTFSLNSIYWFYTTIFSITDPWYTALENIVEEPKVFALYYRNGSIYLYLLNYSRMFYLIDHSRKVRISRPQTIDGVEYDYEWLTFIGKYGATKNKLFPWEKIKEYQNTLQLPYTNLIEGSININWKLIPHFLVNGYSYDNGNIDFTKINEYDITQDNIYYDNINNYLYSYNNNKKIKFAIIQENNKYFKNLLYVYCKYNTELITQGTNIIERGILSAIPNIEFDSAKTSLKDRLLQIEQINVRSSFNINLESTQFSNYLKLTGIIKGLYIEDPDNINSKKYFSIGYRDAPEPKLTGNRLLYASELNKIFPLRFNSETELNERYPYETIDFTNATWPNGTKILSPVIQTSRIYNDLTADPDKVVFKYYKNTLILEGKIDIIDPGFIDFSDNPRVGDALTKIATGDPIVSIVGLNSLQTKSYKEFRIYENDTTTSTIQLEFLDFNNGYLIGASATHFFVHACSDINNLGDLTTLASGETFYKIVTPLYSTNTSHAYNKITSLSYDSDNLRWILALSGQTGQNIYSDLVSLEVIDLNSDGSFIKNAESYKLTYNTDGVDINTYQKITIRDEVYEGSTHYNINAEVFARDVAFSFVDANNISTLDQDLFYNQTNLSTPINVAGTALNEKIINGSTKLGSFQLNSNGGTVNIGTQISLANRNFKVVSFWLEKDGSSTGENHISIGVSEDSSTALVNRAVKEIWTYNYHTGMWEVSRNMSAFNNFITEFGAKNVCIPVTAYLVNENYLYKNPDSEFVLQNLPVPNINTIAIVLQATPNPDTASDYKVQLKATISSGLGVNKFNFYDFRVITPKELIYTDIDNFNYIENPYNTVIGGNGFNILQKESQFFSDKWTAYNGDYQAVITGNSLFIKSPTRTAVSNPVNPIGQHNYSNNFTTRYHWKRAELPSVSDITYSLFNRMTLEQAYDFVYNQYVQVQDLVNTQSSGVVGEESTAYDALKTFLSRTFTIDGTTFTGPLKYIRDEDLPVEIKEMNVILYQTEKGLIPYFDTSSSVFHTWKSTQDSKFELGDIIDVYLKRQNYLRYLADYYSAILGTRRFEYFFKPDGIKDFKLTEKALIIQTKYDDIITLDSSFFSTRKDLEDYNNWYISNIDEDYVFSEDNGEKFDRIIGFNNGGSKYVTIKQMPVIFTDKAFKLLNKYTENNISIYCGYIKITNAVVNARNNIPDLEETILSLFPNNSANIPDKSQSVLYDTRYPVIYFSTDNQNFTRCEIPIQEFMTDITNYTNTTNNLEAFDIVREGNTIKVWMRENGSITKGYTTFTVGIFGDTNTLVYNSEIISSGGNENSLITLTTKEIKNSFLNSLNTMIVGNLNDVDNYLTNNSFLINQQYRPDISNSTVSLKEDAAIRYTPAPIESTVSEILSVLVAIDTTYLISDQSIYVDYDQKYLDTVRNSYKVPEYVEVNDKNSSNRMYSPREAMITRPPTDLDMTRLYERELNTEGMPAIEEDIDHSVYEYYDPFTDENNVEIYRYVEATNKEGDYIYLCDQYGQYLASRNITSYSQVYNLKTIIENGIPISELAKAGVVKPDYSPISLDTSFTDEFNDLISKTIHYISFASAHPLLYIDIPDMETILISYLESLNLDPSKKLFYEWPSSPLENLYYEDTYNLLSIPAADADFINLRNEIEKNEGIFDKIERPFGNRFKKFVINSKEYILDITTNTLPFQLKKTIENNFNVPFLFQAGIQIFTNKGFNTEEDMLYSPNLEYPVTGIYIPTGGYGGYLNNTNWLERCDEIDYRAWDHTRLLKNQFNEYIYQCDYRGNKLFLKHGLFFLESHEQMEVFYNNIAYEGLNHFTLAYDLNSIATTYNLYKIKPSLPEIYSPKFQIWFNHQYDNGNLNNNPNNLALIKIIKSGVEITNFTGYTFEFLDYEDKPVILLDSNNNIITNVNCKLEFSSGHIWYRWDTAQPLTEIPKIEGNVIKLKVTDEYGQEVVKEFEVQDSSEKEPLRITSITQAYITNETFINPLITVTFDNNSIIGEEEVLKSEDLSIIPNEFSIKKNVNTTVTLTFKNLLQSSRVFYYSNMFTFDLDLRYLDLNFCVKKNWTTLVGPIPQANVKNEFDIKILSGDRDLTANPELMGYFSYSTDDNNIIITVTGGEKLVQPYSRITDPIIKINSNFKYVYFKDPDSQSTSIEIIKHTDTNATNKILVDGIYGLVLLKVPNYLSFQDLLDKLENIIEYKNRRIITTIDPFTKVEFNNFVEIARNNSYIILDKLINYDKFVDGGNNYLKIKILPVQSIYPSLKTANNDEYVWEVTQRETDMYGLDRIWINEKSYPLPPILINKVLYHSENIPYYYENTWMNKDNFTIYSCDENGKYVKYVPAGKELLSRVLGNSRGDIRSDVYGNIDPRHNPLEPIYKSSLDWFLSEYYIKGKESNPFNIELNLLEEVKEKKFNQIINITQKTKLDNDFINKKISDSYVSSIINNIRYEPNLSAHTITQENSIDYIDYVNGIINFSIVEPSTIYRDNQRLFLFGINYYNQYYLRDSDALLRNTWFGVTNIDNKINLNFCINSFENYLDKKNKDYAVRWFTEMGVFDQWGHMIAYCTHPKVEYRTDSQHISYTLIIQEPD